MEGKEGDHLGPRVGPQLDHGRILAAPLLGELQEPLGRGGLARGGVDGPEVPGDLVPVLPGTRSGCCCGSSGRCTSARPDGQAPEAFGRFEATRPNELWVGDALHGPKIAGHKAYLFAFVDDNSRAVVGHRWGGAEDSVRLAAALRPALAARGVPEGVYVDYAEVGVMPISV